MGVVKRDIGPDARFYAVGPARRGKLGVGEGHGVETIVKGLDHRRDQAGF